MNNHKINLGRITCKINNLIDHLTKPSNKELRLMLAIIYQHYGYSNKHLDFLLESGNLQFIIEKDFGYIVEKDRIRRLRSFKKIVKKTTIGGDRKLHTEIRYKRPF
jgi:hypothetical protein